MSANDKDISQIKITPLMRGNWSLVVRGPIRADGKTQKHSTLKFSAVGKSLDECLEQLDQWRKGVIIV